MPQGSIGLDYLAAERIAGLAGLDWDFTTLSKIQIIEDEINKIIKIKNENI